MFKRIDDTTEIDTDFITCAEYQLFLDEMRERGEYYQPDHWTAYTFFETMPKLSATDPVLGVRAEDAKVFVNWLNEREKATYRLPTPIEAKEFPINMKSVATWCYEDKKFTLGGLGKPEYQEIGQRLKKLSTLPLLNHWVSLFVSFSNFYHTRDHDLARELAHNLARELALDLALALVRRALALDLARALAETIDRELYTLEYKVLYQLSVRQFDAALSRIRQLQNDSPSVVQQRKLTLLIDLIHCQTVPTSEIRQAFRKYVVHLLEYAWVGLNELERKQKILELYWQLKIIEAREAGELPAWEGIRLVRVTAEK